jgi:hypothetical protein
LISLDLNHFGFALNFFDKEHDQEIDSIVSLINNNEKMIRSLHIRDDRIEGHILNDICGERDFNELTLNCLLISLQNLVQTLESQQKLRILKLTHSDYEESIVKFSQPFSICSLNLIGCNLAIELYQECLRSKFCEFILFIVFRRFWIL